MKFDVKPACRDGQVIPKYQLNAVVPIRGVLDIQQEWWPEHNRHSLRATITGESGAEPRSAWLPNWLVNATHGRALRGPFSLPLEGDGALAAQRRHSCPMRSRTEAFIDRAIGLVGTACGVGLAMKLAGWWANVPAMGEIGDWLSMPRCV